VSGAPDTSHWSLDKRVPLALILTIIVQTVSVIWFAAALWQQVQSQGARLDAIEAMKTDARLIRLEEGMANMKPQLDRIETKLDRLTGYPDKPN
jgi:hypothetical protein